MEKELRRRRIELFSLGAGVIAFGVWNVLKFILYLAVTPMDYASFGLDVNGEPAIVALSYAVIVLIFAVSQSLHLYVGLSARAEGRGEKKGKAYIILAAVMVALNIGSWYFYISDFLGNKLEDQSRLDYIVSFLVDVTSVLTLGDLLFTALRVRKLSRELEG